MKIAGIIISLIAIVAILVVVGCYLWKKVAEGIESKYEIPKTKVDGDNIKVRFVFGKQATVFNYNTKEKKFTVKGKEKDCFNGIKAILAADGTVYFYVDDIGILYQLKNEKIIVATQEDDDDDDDWD